MKLKREEKNFWEKFLEEKGLSNNTPGFEVFTFGDSEDLSEELLKLVLEGKKTGTALSGYIYKDENKPKIGDYSIIIDWFGKPRCIIKTTLVLEKSFREYTYDIVKKEGEDKNLKSWQDNHESYFLREGERVGYKFTWDMPVVFEEFELVFIG